MHPAREQLQCTRVGIATAALMAALVSSACSREAGNTSPAAAPPPASSTAVPAPAPVSVATDKVVPGVRMKECRTKLEAALSTDLVRNASVDNGRPKLWVGPAWHQSTPAAKEALARDAACFFLSGDESKTIRFSVYDDSDREVAVWNLSQLVTW